MAERLRLMEKLRENAPPGEESALFRSSEVNPPPRQRDVSRKDKCIDWLGLQTSGKSTSR